MLRSFRFGPMRTIGWILPYPHLFGVNSHQNYFDLRKWGFLLIDFLLLGGLYELPHSHTGHATGKAYKWHRPLLWRAKRSWLLTPKWLIQGAILPGGSMSTKILEKNVS